MTASARAPPGTCKPAVAAQVGEVPPPRIVTGTVEDFLALPAHQTVADLLAACLTKPATAPARGTEVELALQTEEAPPEELHPEEDEELLPFLPEVVEKDP